MERDGEPVRFVADALDQQQRRIVGRQRDRILAIARVKQLLLFRDADRDEIRQPQFLERRVGGRQLALAAVDHDQVRKRPALLEQLSVSTENDFVHGGEVVLNGLSGLGARG